MAKCTCGYEGRDVVELGGVGLCRFCMGRVALKASRDVKRRPNSKEFHSAMKLQDSAMARILVIIDEQSLRITALEQRLGSPEPHKIRTSKADRVRAMRRANPHLSAKVIAQATGIPLNTVKQTFCRDRKKQVNPGGET